MKLKTCLFISPAVSNWMFFFIVTFYLKPIFASDLEKLAKSQDLKLDQSIALVRLSDGKKLFSHKSESLVIPASVSKLTIAAAALDLWGSDHTFNTKVFITGNLKGGEVSGDLYIIGDGDPFLTNEKLFILASDIRRRGIRKIAGDLYLDNSLFDAETRDPSRDEGKKASDNAYDAPVSATGVNFNTFEVAMAVTENTPEVFFYPYDLKGFSIENRLSAASKTAAQVERLSLQDGRAKLIASGTIGRDDNLVKFYRSVNDPSAASAEVIRSFLENQSIKILGKNKVGATPASAKKIAEIDGFPLHFIVRGLNNFSNNYIADMLLKRLGAAFSDEENPDKPYSGSIANGIKVLKNYLINQVQIKTPFVLANASGLSTDNRLSADQVNQILLKMGQSLELYPEFFSSLPMVGKVGTLKKRFRKSEVENMSELLRAKTGTLTSPRTVVSLAGYLKTRKNGIVAFSILQNGSEKRSQPSVGELREIQDRMVQSMAEEF